MAQLPTEKEIFRIACALETEELRSQYLGQVCGDDPALRSRIEELLRIAVREETALLPVSPVAGVTDVTPAWPPSAQPGEMLGPYRLCERIGEGGFGVVFAAQQTQPISRRVALKIIKPGMDSREVIARFNAERRALALMDHPSIARVIDAGRAANGRPYFVMELVEGVPITQFCDDESLDTRQRLRLFVDVCRAVQHAHQKGIIHRDLKPSNVLTARTEDGPVAKVIDFGVAKALSGQLTADSVYTAQGQMIGTPLYMSPEQAATGGQDIDTRSDIYSLGVLLYELLIGMPPVDRSSLEGSGPEQVQWLLREFTPLKPSARLSTLSADQRSQICDRRQVEDRQLIHELRGELDWIAMKALEKDRNRRYESAAALADDIDRFLAGDAVLAGPPSRTYRLRKLAYRYRGLLASVVLIFLTLAVGLVTALLQRQEALTARAQVEHTLEEVRLQQQRAEVLAYAADIRVAAQALDRGNVVEAFEMLNRHQPPDGATDYRGLEWSLLMGRARGSSSTTPVSDRPLYTVCQSPDGAHLVTGGADGMISILDAQTYARVRAFDSGQIEVNGLSFAPDGQTLVSTGDDGNIRLWKFPSGEPRQTISFGADKSYKAFITPDGESLIACGHAPDVRIFSLAEGKLVARLEGHERTVNEIALSPDGDVVACASSDSQTSVWDWRARKRIYASGDLGGRVTSVAFSPDGRWVLAGCVRGRVQVTDFQTRRRIARFELGEDIQEVAAVPDGSSLIALTRTGSLHRLPLDAKAESAESAPAARIVHSGRVYDAHWSDPQTLITAGGDGHLGRSVLAGDSAQVREISGVRARDVAVSPDGALIVWWSFEKLGLYDLVKDEHLFVQEPPAGTDWLSASFSPDGDEFMAGTNDGSVLAFLGRHPQEATVHRVSPGADIISIHFCEDGSRISVIDWTNNDVFVLAIPTWQEIRCLPFDAELRIAQLNRDGSRVAVARGRDLLVYDVDTGRSVATSQRHHAEQIRDLYFLSGDQSIVSIGEDRQIRLWDWQASQPSELVGVHPAGRQLQMALSRDTRTLLSRSTEGEIVLWSLPARQRLFALNVGLAKHQRMALSGDDSGLALVDGRRRVHWIPLVDSAARSSPAATGD